MLDHTSPGQTAQATPTPTPLNEVVVFSPKAISIGTFLGGPLAGGILAGINFRRLGLKRQASRAFVLGVAATFALLGLLFGLPAEVLDSIPNFVFPAIYVPLTAWLVNRTQGEQLDVVLSNGGRKASGWLVAGISLGSLVPLVAGALVFVLLMSPFGFKGEKLELGPNHSTHVYVADGVSRIHAAKVVEALIGTGYIDDESAGVLQIRREKNRYEITLPILQRYWDDAGLVAELEALKSHLSDSVFQAPVDLILIDEDMRKTHRKRL